MPATAASAHHALFQPRLTTERLTLRALSPRDLGAIERLAADEEVSRWSAAIPYPLPKGAAYAWITESEVERQRGEAVTFGIERQEDRRFLGGITLGIDHHRRQGDVGYWLGRCYWQQGFGTEALRRILHFGLHDLDLVEIVAYTFPDNLASLRIQQKAGMIDLGFTRREIDDVLHKVRVSRVRRSA